MDLNKALVKNPSSTFYARVKGESMINDGVDDGDLLVIDRSVEPYGELPCRLLFGWRIHA